MISYWEQQSFLHYDHIIIGSGIVGLSTAIELKSVFPKHSILILERGLLPTGASSRNAGFACMGSVTELLDDMKNSAEEDVVALFAQRKNGLLRLRNRLGDNAIDYKEEGSFELIDQSNIVVLESIEYLNKLLAPVTGKDAFQLASDKIDTFGFNKNNVAQLIQNNLEGSLDTGKMLRALIRLALSLDIEIKTGATVTSFEEKNNSVTVLLADAFRNSEISLSCQSLVLCTNAFTKELLPDVDVRPGRGQVLITKPIGHLPFKGIFHLEEGYYYFRTIENRVLFGGGRNLDFDKEATTSFDLNMDIQNVLDEKLRTIILPNIKFEIDMRWTGIMAFGPTKQPIVKAFSDRVFGAFRMGGMGVALGSEVAFKIGTLVKEKLN